MKSSRWRMPHPATMFLLLTVAVIITSWICDIYGFSAHFPQSGEDIRVQNLMSEDGLRWLLQNVIKNFTNFTPLGMAVVAMFGLGLAQHSGLIDACIRLRAHHHHRSEKKQMIAWVVALGILSNLVGDAGYIILLPIAATMFRSVNLDPIAGIVAAYVSVACGYSANLFLSIIDPILAINTEKAALTSNQFTVGVGPMCNYYFFFVSAFVIGFLIYYVTCRMLLSDSKE